MNDKPLVEDILQFGKADDDCVFDVFQGIYFLTKGYYKLINYGDEWWEDTLNQDIWCNQMIKVEWEKINWEQFETTLEKITKIMIGSYVSESKFYKALEVLHDKGIGYRPQRKEGKNDTI